MCYSCGLRGHVRAACRKNQQHLRHVSADGDALQGSDAQEGSREDGTTQPRSSSPGTGEEVYSIFTVRTGLGVRRPPLMVPVALDGQKVEMELDTGATLSVCSDAGFRQLWPCGGPKLEPCSVKLKTYSGEQLPVMGQAAVNVQYGGQAQRLPLIVVEGSGPWLFGRNWLGHIRLDWPSIC